MWFSANCLTSLSLCLTIRSISKIKWKHISNECRNTTIHINQYVLTAYYILNTAHPFKIYFHNYLCPRCWFRTFVMGEKLFSPKTEKANVQELICKLHWRQSFFFPQQKHGDGKHYYYFKEKEKHRYIVGFPLYVFIVTLSKFSSGPTSAISWNKMSYGHK